MALSFCVCPLEAALPDLLDTVCEENLGQIQKVIVRRQQTAALFPDVATAQVIASYTPLFSALDLTKIQITPKIENIVIPQGEALTEGGNDNTTIGGAEVITGQSFIGVTGNFASLPATDLKSLRKLNCELDLELIFITQSKKIVYYSEDGTTLRGFPVSAFYVGSQGNEGFGTRDKTPIRFNMLPDWSENRVIVTPADFNPLRDLTNT